MHNELLLLCLMQAQGQLQKLRRTEASERVARALAFADLPRLQRALRAAERAGLSAADDPAVATCRRAIEVCAELREMVQGQVRGRGGGDTGRSTIGAVGGAGGNAVTVEPERGRGEGE